MPQIKSALSYEELLPIFLLLFAIALAVPVLWPSIDLLASGLFYRVGVGFFLADNPAFLTLHWLAYYGARALGVAFALMALAAWTRHKSFCAFNAKSWLFLLLALLIGPALVANAGFKDHWGRARPREIVEFGGTAQFSPALVPQTTVRPNGSFVSGDGAFGFFLPAFAYIVPRRRARQTFWACMGGGGLFGLARLAMGAHFLSDILFAAAFMLTTSTLVHAAMYGRHATADRWQLWFSNRSDV
jgi:lipid A 4'-phosphatase